MSVKMCCVCEAQADFAMARDLIDRLLRTSKGWVEELDSLDDLRHYSGDTTLDSFLRWDRIDRLALDRGVRFRLGRFQGRTGQADAIAARRALQTVMVIHPDASVIVLVRDQDNQPQRRQGIEQALGEFHHIPVVFGLAVRSREAWVISGFEPRSEDEHQRLRDVTSDAGFDPRLKSHRLTTDTAKSPQRKAKRILDVLTSGEWERQAACWEETPLPILQERGQDNGLAEFLSEVEQILVPVVTND